MSRQEIIIKLPFQSTRPIRGATCNMIFCARASTDFNPRAPYGARPKPLSATRLPPTFQSTRPIRGATRTNQHTTVEKEISIHAPHTGRDAELAPLSPGTSEFQSTRPIRGATQTGCLRRSSMSNFNPRAPYGARRVPSVFRAGPVNFNPRAPYGARPGKEE